MYGGGLMSSIHNVRMKNLRDTEANWTANNPVLLNGEVVLVDTADGRVRTKIGDGATTYSNLPFGDDWIDEKVPFSFGVDANGNYGYIKAGADTVTPFKRVSKKVGTIVCGLSERSLDYSGADDRDELTVDNFYLMPTAFTIIDSPVTGEPEGTITFGEYQIRKTYSNYILRVRRDSIPGNVAVDLICDVYVIY